VHGALASAVLRPGGPAGVDWCIAEALRVRAMSVFNFVLLACPRMVVRKVSFGKEGFIHIWEVREAVV
jgi:hypothetical protein